MSDATGVAEAMLGLPGFRVLQVTEGAAELVIRIELCAELVGCPACGVIAQAHDRMTVEYRDLPGDLAHLHRAHPRGAGRAGGPSP